MTHPHPHDANNVHLHPILHRPAGTDRSQPDPADHTHDLTGHRHDHDAAENHHHSGHSHDHTGAEHHEHPHGWKGVVVSVFRPHSHDSADSVDSELEGSTRGIRAVKISLVALGITAVLQLLVVAVSGSVALLADTVHNFSDALTAVPLWIAFALSRRAASRRYTYGYGRAEDLAGLFIVAMIALSAAVAGWEAVNRLIHPAPVEHLGWVAAAGLIGFAGNELVAVYRIRVGTRIGSAALVADGRHARTDGLTSLAVVLGALGVALGWPAADPIIGLVIAVLILLVLRTATRDVFRRLMDGVDPAILSAAESSLLATAGVRSIRRLRIRWLGHTLHAEADLEVDPALSLTQAHQIAHHAEAHLLHHVQRLTDATIHTSPAGAPPRRRPANNIMRHAHHRRPEAGEDPDLGGGVIHWARRYDLLTVVLLAGRGRRLRSQLSRLLALHPGHRVLDVGCGTGTLALALAEVVGAGGSVHGIDAAPEMIAAATRKAARRSLPAVFQVATAQYLPFPDGSMDAVAMSLALHHLPTTDRAQAIAELLRVLRPGGHLAIVEFDPPTSVFSKTLLRHTLGPVMAGNTLAPIVDILRAAGAVDIQQTTTTIRWLAVVTARAHLSGQFGC